MNGLGFPQFAAAQLVAAYGVVRGRFKDSGVKSVVLANRILEAAWINIGIGINRQE